MVKGLLLQQWYTASDPEIEAALWDRLSLRRFVGLGLPDPVPVHSTISRFRSALAAPPTRTRAGPGKAGRRTLATRRTWGWMRRRG